MLTRWPPVKGCPTTTEETGVNHSNDPDRRPIPVRDRRLSRALCHGLIRMGISSNAISLFGRFAGVAGGVVLAAARVLFSKKNHQSNKSVGITRANYQTR